MPLTLLQFESNSQEILALSLEAPPFNETVLSDLSSQDLWDHFPSPSPNVIENIINTIHPSPSPAKIHQTGSQLLADLKLPTPLTTPVSRKVSTIDKQNIHYQDLRNLARTLRPFSPDSPGSDPLQMRVRLDTLTFGETVSAESSLRQPVPHIPPPSPKKEVFPTSMFSLYIATEGLSCPDIPQSTIDLLNEQVKWQPFTKTLKNLNIGTEEVDGDWETYIDWSRSTTWEDEMIVLERNISTTEEELPLERWDGRKKGNNDPPGLAELVRKRKMEIPDRTSGEGDFDTITKRSKWSQRYRIEEYMKVRGLNIEINEDKTPEKLLIRKLYLSITNGRLAKMSPMLKLIHLQSLLHPKRFTQQSHRPHLTHQRLSAS